MKQENKDYSQIRTMYEDQLLSLATIAKKLDVSRQTVHNQLKLLGVDTKKRLRETKCSLCEKTLLVPRSSLRRKQYHFCNHKEYLKFICKSEYSKEWMGQKVGRIVFASVVGTLSFDPQIYHVDGNHENNHPDNLWGFKSKVDYMIYLRGGRVMALKAKTGNWEEVEIKK